MARITVREVSENAFLEWIKKHTSPGMLLKFCEKGEYSIDFAEKGIVCLSTAAYIRRKEKNSERHDKEGFKAFHSTLGQPVDLSPLCSVKVKLNNDIKDRPLILEDCVSFLMFCAFQIREPEETEESLKALLAKGENDSLGRFCVVVPDPKELLDAFQNPTFHKNLGENCPTPILGKRSPYARAVTYKNNPNNLGFEKEPRFACQQEYRFLFSFQIPEFTPQEKFDFPGLFLYKITPPKDATVFKILRN